MREHGQSVIWATCAVLVVGSSSLGSTPAASARRTEEACIRSGGQVINAGDSFHCLRGVSVNGETR